MTTRFIGTVSGMGNRMPFTIVVGSEVSKSTHLGDRAGGLNTGSSTKGNCATRGKGGVHLEVCGGTVWIRFLGEYGFTLGFGLK